MRTIERDLRFETIDLPGSRLPGLAVSAVREPRADVLVLPGIHGRTPHILTVAQSIAHRGLRAVIADSYCEAARNGSVSTPEGIAKATQELDRGQAVSSVAQLTTELAAARPVAIVGYCVGGSFALQVAAQVSELRGVVVFYGVLRPGGPADSDVLTAAKNGRSPVIAHYGTTDIWCPQQDVDDLAEQLAASESSWQIYRYEGAGHAFQEDGRPGYRPVAAAESLERSLHFLEYYTEEG